jgi:hypothetical protein
MSRSASLIGFRSGALFLNALATERKRWRKEMQTDFVKGIIQGLLIASQHIEAYGAQENSVRDAYLQRVARWKPCQYERIIRRAARFLGSGMSTRAFNLLKETL